MTKLARCPNCHDDTIPLFEKISLAKKRPCVCKNCGSHSFVPGYSLRGLPLDLLVRISLLVFTVGLYKAMGGGLLGFVAAAIVFILLEVVYAIVRPLKLIEHHQETEKKNGF
ncbi:hypothetical protein [Hyphococcus sp.]|uniref:hypothetical protein n=1 Tax=Hyphococcus sp. TaxID=2038636 RepID=UPI00208C6372|nr:MAG: hypothetical protein DHS20C04_04030 [Marinicaulis sp.]